MRSTRSIIADGVLLLAVIALIAVGVVSYLNVSRLTAASESVSDSRRVLEWIAGINSDVTEIERGALGYALTGSESFLIPYRQAAQQQERKLSLLRQATRADAAQQASLGKLAPLIARRLAAATVLIQTRNQQGAEAARQAASNNGAATAVTEVRALLDSIEKYESAQLDKRTASAQDSASKAKLIIVLGSLAGIGMVALVIFALKRDIAARHLAERQANSEHGLMIELVNHLSDLIYIKDAKGRFQIVNRAYRKFLAGDEQAVVEGKTVYDFLKPHWAEIQDRDEQAVIRSKRAFVDRIERNGLEEDARWVQSTKVPVFNDKGELTQLIGMHRDVSQIREIQEELKRAKTQIESAGRAKADFLANISHELRTPMNGIVGMTELVLDTEIEPQQREYLVQVKNSAQSLLDLLNNICDFSKSEEGAMTLENNPFDLHELISGVIKPMRTRATEKQLQLTCRVSENVCRWVRGDAARLRQVLVNLIGNAIKFTEQGEVVVEVKQEVAPSQQVQLQFSIRDSGIGVPEAKRQEIFEAFAQADTSHTRQYGGTGLGLTIASRVVQLMGERLWLDSVEGLGSTFFFTAVLAISEEVRPATPAARSVAGLGVLVVDPNMENRYILEGMLKDWKMRPVLASSGSVALDELWQAYQDGKAFSVVLVEANMPQMDGFEMARHIKAEPELQSARIILLSSTPVSQTNAELKAAGIETVVSIPVQSGELLRAINGNTPPVKAAPAKAAPVATPSVVAAPVPQPAPPTVVEVPAIEAAGGIEIDGKPTDHPLNILVADDNPVNQTVAVGILSKRGHRLFKADNGVEAVASYEQNLIDIVLMDIQMPEMDGLAATRAIRRIESKTGRRVPIVAVTAHAMKGDRERYLARGMDAYLSKPFTGEQIVGIVESFGVRHAGGVPTGGPAAAQSAVVVASKAELMSEFGDASLVTTLVDLFLDQAPKLVADIEKALAANDAVALERSAHTLKGSVGNFRAKNAWQLAQSIEYAGRSGDTSAVSDIFTELTEELARVKTALESYR